MANPEKRPTSQKKGEYVAFDYKFIFLLLQQWGEYE
jgi:hypothetical protein